MSRALTNRLWAGASRVAAFLSLLALLLAGACRPPLPQPTGPSTGSGQARGEVICYVGTQAYRQKLKGLPVQPADARRRLGNYLQAQAQRASPQSDARVFVGEHSLIIGEAYHFYLPSKMGGIPRTGYYVDGHSGAVEYKVDPGTLPYPPRP